MPQRLTKSAIRKALAAAFAFAWLAYFHFALDWMPETPSPVEDSQSRQTHRPGLGSGRVILGGLTRPLIF